MPLHRMLEGVKNRMAPLNANAQQHQQPTDTSTTPFVCVDDYANAALSKLSDNALGYYASGAMAHTTLRENRTAMNRYLELHVSKNK